MVSMAELDAILEEGGEPCIALLRWSVMSVTLEPVFMLLVREYRLRPAHAAAVAVYDLVCAADAPARIQAPDLLPPRDLKLLAAAQMLRRQLQQMR